MGDGRITMHKLPFWAPRIDISLIFRLYKSDAKGLLDDELLDEVAYGLYTRALSILEVTHVHETGYIKCPICRETVFHNPNSSSSQVLLICSCGWEVTWNEYFKTYHRKQLVGGAATQIVQNAVDSFRTYKNAEEKMRWVDNLIHAFHGQLQDEYYRPAACNFIDGNAKQVIELIYSLAYGEGSPLERIVQGDLWKYHLSLSYAAHKAPK
jgi:hypothetical protein